MKPIHSSFVTIAAGLLLAQASLADPAITAVTAQQRYPWNGKVDIAYTVSGDIPAFAKEQALITSLKVMATDQETGTSYAATSLSGDTGLSDGTHSLVWDMDAQGLTFVSTNVIFSVSCETVPATYCVIDLSSGSNSVSYPVTYLAEPPSGGFNVNEYKTTKLVLKRMEAGSFMMGENQDVSVTLTKPFYMGLFEMTQTQWQLVMGSNPSSFDGELKPVEAVSYSDIRGSTNGAQWPKSNAVDSDSFLGKLRARTGLDFDLPTEAQWEYACRAGTTTKYSYGDSANGNYMWYEDNSSRKTHSVGIKQPNPWGLYDMHGNVSEWCLNYGNGDLIGGTDPKGPTKSTSWSYVAREIRGGSWYRDSTWCTSSYRYNRPPSDTSNSFGFRLSRPLTMNSQGGTLCSGTNAPTIIDLSTGTRTAALSETIRYSAAWETSAAGATAVVAVNGETLSSATGSGATVWQPTRKGTYTLTHKVMNGGAQVGATLTATFAVQGPATPVISPEGGVVSGWPQSITMFCATEGTTIHYTTDGTDPTADSPTYRRFRISERTTVKAIAVKGGVMSEIAVAEYALGVCDDPVIDPVDGTSFEHLGQTVSIDWQGEDGVLRYTTDGNDPTAESPIYEEPFTLDNSTVVKAKAFGDQFFDSAVVTANLTRVWVNVATPVITAASSFTGSKTKVTLSCATAGATIRYTLNGNDPNSHATRYTKPFYVTDSCTVKAYAVCADYLASDVATFSIEKVWDIGDTMGAPDHAFTTGGDLPFVRVVDATAPLGESMKSGEITHEQVSTLSTTVMGPGTISFQWKTSCEDSGGAYDWDHAEFEVDGDVVAKMDGVTGWQTVSHAISSGGSHTLVWSYVKDDVESEGEDCCWVADYNWASDYTATQTTPEPVPYVWLLDYFPETPDEYDFYEAAAFATAENGVNEVWECYVAGLDPTNSVARFEATITMDANGKPEISHNPPLPAAEAAKREYRILGAEMLDAPEPWTDVTDIPDLDRAGYRFFKVKVRMKE